MSILTQRRKGKLAAKPKVKRKYKHREAWTVTVTDMWFSPLPEAALYHVRKSCAHDWISLNSPLFDFLVKQKNTWLCSHSKRANLHKSKLIKIIYRHKVFMHRWVIYIYIWFYYAMETSFYLDLKELSNLIYTDLVLSV